MAPSKILLIVHIFAGFTALTAATVATLTKTLNVAHRWHVYSGTVFFCSMVVIFFTAIPLSLIRPNTFLFLIAILSFYLPWRVGATPRIGAAVRDPWIGAVPVSWPSPLGL